ncbi:hypothetical protein EV426DRAFT_578979 [Tirmania nivea]|nr:hypothetical protein EV426DRAFT_578979 [Tirmania nivea]
MEGKKLGRVYASGKWHRLKWKEWLGRVRGWMGHDGGVVGDWNAHSLLWNAGCKENSRGKVIAEWTEDCDLEIAEGGGPWIWKRERNSNMERSRIDVFLSKSGERGWGEVKSEKLASDHWAIKAEFEGVVAAGIREVREKVAVDWKQLEKLVEELGEKGDAEENRWYLSLSGSTPYNKLKALRTQYSRSLKIMDKSKR